MTLPGVGQPFLLGVNYWPRRKAMYWWEDFDAAEVRDEFALIRDLGFTYVRIFLLWESFQPTPRSVPARRLDDLRTVCDVAAELGLRLQLTFFTGQMSGPAWAPAWLRDPRRSLGPGDRQVVTLSRPADDRSGIRNIYGSKAIISAEDRLLTSVCTALRDHPGVWAWSLGNEPDAFARPASALAGRSWIRDRTALIKGIDPSRPVLVGLHTADLDGDVGFRLDDVARETDISVMHGYSIYSHLARGPLDPDLVPFLAAMSAALAGRPVLFEEFGINTGDPDGPSHWLDLELWRGQRMRAHFAAEDDAAAYTHAVLDRLVRVGALGAFAWCFADYHPDLWTRPPCDLQVHERFFGIVRHDGSLKPSADVIRRFAAGSPVIQIPERTVELDVSPDVYYADPQQHLSALYERFGMLGGSSPTRPTIGRVALRSD